MLPEALEREQELLLSAGLGMIFSFGVIYFLHKYPGRPFDYVNDRYIDNVSVKKKDDDAPDTYHDENQLYENENNDEDIKSYMENLNEDDFVRSTRKIQNKFGISEENVRLAVRKTKEDVCHGGHVQDESFSYSQLLDFFVLGCIVCIILYFIDVEAHGIHGDISRILEAIFPSEFNTLGVGGQKRNS